MSDAFSQVHAFEFVIHTGDFSASLPIAQAIMSMMKTALSCGPLSPDLCFITHGQIRKTFDPDVGNALATAISTRFGRAVYALYDRHSLRIGSEVWMDGAVVASFGQDRDSFLLGASCDREGTSAEVLESALSSTAASGQGGMNPIEHALLRAGFPNTWQALKRLCEEH